MFAALVIWALALLSEERSVAMIGLAYLTRSAALPLYAGVAVIQLWRHQWQRLGILIAGAALPVGGWTVWVAAHRYSAQSAVEKYYTDYLAYQWHVVPLMALPAHIVQQLDPLVAAVSRSLLLNFSVSTTRGYLYTQRKALRLPELGSVVQRSSLGEYRPTVETLAAMDRFNLACLFVSTKHFDPDPRFPDAPLKFSIESTGLEERYRSRTELVACRPAKEVP